MGYGRLNASRRWLDECERKRRKEQQRLEAEAKARRDEEALAEADLKRICNFMISQV